MSSSNVTTRFVAGGTTVDTVQHPLVEAEALVLVRVSGKEALLTPGEARRLAVVLIEHAADAEEDPEVTLWP